MIVTKIEENNRSKVALFFDNGEQVLLYKSELRRLDLKEGEEVTEEAQTGLLQDIFIPRAKKRAMHLLEKKDYTEARLREKLRESGYPLAAVDAAVAYVKGYHYIDDARYAAGYIHDKGQRKSKRMLFYGLLQRGVPAEVATEVLERELGNSDEGVKIEALLVKKRYDPKEATFQEKQKMYQFLLRRGFESEEILRRI